MKNYTLMLALCASIFYLTSLTAQDTEVDRKFRFGLKGATNVSWGKTDNKNMENDAAGMGFTYGLMGDYRFGKNYSFTFGLDVTNFNHKMGFLSDTTSLQSKSSATGNDTILMYPASSVYKNHMGFVNIPVALKMSTNEIGYMTYFAQFGLELGVQYKAEADVESTVLKPSGLGTILAEDYDIATQTSLFRTALVIGGGVEYNISGKTSLVVGLTYSNGFSNMYTKNYTLPDPNVDNRTVTFDKNGDLKYSGGKLLVDGDFKQAYLRYITLNVGVFF